MRLVGYRNRVVLCKGTKINRDNNKKIRTKSTRVYYTGYRNEQMDAEGEFPRTNRSSRTVTVVRFPIGERRVEAGCAESAFERYMNRPDRRDRVASGVGEAGPNRLLTKEVPREMQSVKEWPPGVFLISRSRKAGWSWEISTQGRRRYFGVRRVRASWPWPWRLCNYSTGGYVHIWIWQSPNWVIIL